MGNGNFKEQLFILSLCGLAACGEGKIKNPPVPVEVETDLGEPIAYDDTELSDSTFQVENFASQPNISGVELKITTPLRRQQPYRLAIYLHGDTAWEHNADGQPDGYGGRKSPLASMKNFALANNFVFVSARSPNRRSWWTDDGVHFADHSRELDAALESVIRRYGIRRDRFFFGGASGGSTFSTAEFIPNFGRKYPGVYALMCGGAQRYRNLQGLNRSLMRLFFNFGDRDFLYNLIRPTAALYKANGISSRETIYRGTTHCGFDTTRAIASIWRSQL